MRVRSGPTGDDPDVRVHDIRLGHDVEVRAYVSGEVAEAGERAVSVLLHGVGMTHRTYWPVQQQLAAHGPVVSFDLAGFGPTRKPGRVLSVEDHAAVIERALERLGVGRMVLVGHSMGTQFAIELALRRPDAVEAVVLIGPVVDSARRTVPKQALDLARDTLREPIGVNAVVITDYLRCGLRWYLANLREMFEYDTEERLGRTTVPVLVVRGEHDPIARRAWCDRLVAAAPAGGQLLTIFGRAHVAPRSAVTAIAAAIAGVARATDGATATEVASATDGATGARSRARVFPSIPAAMRRALPNGRGGHEAERLARRKLAARRAIWWMLDYAYAGFWQVRGWLGPRRASHYRTGTRHPVLVLPGVYESWHFLRPLIAAMHDAGHPVHVITALGSNRRPVTDGAAAVAAYLREHDLHDVVIVAHSKGGLIGKAAMVEDAQSGDRRVERMIAVSTPFSGSRYARYLPVPSLRVFSPTEASLVWLAQATDVNSRITSLYGIFDPHIPEGSVLPGAQNVQLPVAGHFRILEARPTVDFILDALSKPGDPGNADD